RLVEWRRRLFGRFLTSFECLTLGRPTAGSGCRVRSGVAATAVGALAIAASVTAIGARTAREHGESGGARRGDPREVRSSIHIVHPDQENEQKRSAIAMIRP